MEGKCVHGSKIRRCKFVYGLLGKLDYNVDTPEERALICQYASAGIDDPRGRRQLEKMNFLRNHVERMGSECECSFFDKSCLLNDAVWYTDWGIDDPDDHMDRDALTVVKALQRLEKAGKIRISQEMQDYNDEQSSKTDLLGNATFKPSKW